MEYVNYHFKTNSPEEKWSTAEIEEYLRENGMIKEQGKTSFVMDQPFLNIFPLNVSDFNNWNEEEYSPVETNYIAVVSTDEFFGSYKSEEIQFILSGLEDLLLTELQEEW